MHPVIMRQLAADHISETHARAEDERRAREARRGGGLTRTAALWTTSGLALVKRMKNLQTIKEKERTHSSPVSIYSGQGGLRQDPGRAA